MTIFVLVAVAIVAVVAVAGTLYTVLTDGYRRAPIRPR